MGRERLAVATGRSAREDGDVEAGTGRAARRFTHNEEEIR